MKKLLQILVLAVTAALASSAIAAEKKLSETEDCLTKAGLTKGEHFQSVPDPEKVGRGKVQLRAGLLDHPKFKDRAAAIKACQ